ncbi:MAG TPA: DUF1559 domain-containing protein [Abditibacteriaceae bacterium]
MKRRAFTLIELLVVIAIIAILAAILFPVFARARENARRASCQSNLKQVALSLRQYTQDYDERFPGWYTNNDGGTPFGYQMSNAVGPNTDKGWTELIQPYMKSKQILQCPSEPSPPAPDTSNGWALTPTVYGYSDYFLNANVGGRRVGIANEQPTDGGINESQLAASSLTILNGDGFAFASEHQMSSWPYNSLDPGQFRRHLSGNNFSFCDGHVKWYRPEKITTSLTSAGNPTFSLE